jgi:serine/threonine-protein kinase RsbT
VAHEVLATHDLKLATEEDVLVVRKLVREIAERGKFDTFAIAAITTATSELARNVVVHAKGGNAKIEEVSDGLRAGIRIAFIDDGPGIADVDRVMQGGHSTARSMGLGLSGSRRLVDEFELTSNVGSGTRITVTKWKRF